MYKRKDAFYTKAKKEGYRSRAAYKLLELSEAEKVVGPGNFVVDAGASPGG
ncbi:MAG: RlmE family RNA methyltransferase, partial [Deltaproteobacteria bacterium]|nr:RlmE family RNA methyltransferase [Deltaproteobacteria bacterium]